MVEERSLGVLSRQLVLSLYLPAVLLALGDSLVTPVIPIFTKQFEVGVATASLVFVMVNVGALVAAFSTGYLMDMIGRRPVLLAGPLIMAVGSLMTPFAGSFTQLLCWRLVVGAAHQAWQQACLAIIADTALYGQRARQLQWMMGVSCAGQLFGPAVGGSQLQPSTSGCPSWACHPCLCGCDSQPYSDPGDGAGSSGPGQ